MGRNRISTGLAVLALSSVAQATPAVIAVAPDAPAREPFRHPHSGIGGGVSLGLATATGVDGGWIARIDSETLPALTPRGRFGGLFGFATSGQFWHAGDDWGVGLPWAMMLGVRGPGMRAVAMAGVEMFFVDQVADDTGVGLFAPLAGLQLAVEGAGWHVGVDARVTRRWQFGADDRTQWQAALTVGWIVEAKQREPIH